MKKVIYVLFVFLTTLSSTTLYSQNTPFVPHNFKVPDTLENQHFRMRMLSVNDFAKDFDAVMTSLNHLQEMFLSHWGWPTKELTLEEDSEDLVKHQKEFLERSAFAYTVMSKDESQCLGCVYVDPTSKFGYDAEIYLWVRKSALDNGLDPILFNTVKEWIKKEWPFKNVAYPGRDISWEKWDEIPIKTAYQPFYFKDNDRLNNIRGLEPLIHKVFENLSANKKIPGIAYGIVVDDSLIIASSIGQININKKNSSTIESSFRIASMTKSFTAMSILKLRDEGKLSLDDPISTYIPEMSDLIYPTKDSRIIDIRNLLTMTAGLPEDNCWADRKLDETNEMLKTIVQQGLSFSTIPSTNYEYSNLSYALLGNIISSVSGIPYQDYIRNNILLPLGMNQTYWEFDSVPSNKLALGYRWEEGQYNLEPMLHDGSFGSIGGLITSIVDFSKYVSFQLSAWPARNDEETGPIRRSSLREMQTSQFASLNANDKNFNGDLCATISGYGYGLGISKDCNGVTRVSHGGALPGFSSNYIFYPKYGIGIIAFGNLSNSNPLPKDEIEKLLFEKGQIKPRKFPTPEILAHRQEQVLELIQTWDTHLEQQIVSENLYMDESREQRIEQIQKMFKKAGDIVEIKKIDAWNQLRGSFEIHAKNGIIEVYFALNPEKNPKVQDLYITYEQY